MPYRINKLKNPCKQSDGDKGNWSLTYTDKKGKKHRACHTSKKNAQGQIAAIEGPYENNESTDELIEMILKRIIMEENNG